MALLTAARFALVASVPLALAACFVDSTDHGPRGAVVQGGGAGGSSGGTTTTPSGGDGQPSAYPILAKVDTDQTMQVNPGQGVGVFAEYVSGGHWHVWWTCDSSVNAQGAPCAFDVKLSVSTGEIANVQMQQFESTDTLQSGAQQLEATTTTSTGFDGLLFDTAPGATITVAATVGGLYDGRFLFFVENGQIDDGYQSPVTDPIQLAPTVP